MQNLLAAALLCCLAAPAWMAAAPAASLQAGLARQPVAFELDGPWAFARAGRFSLRTDGRHTILVSPVGSVRFRLEGAMEPRQPKPVGPPSHIRQTFEGARVRIAPRYDRVRFEELYPGVSVEYYERDGDVEYDFFVAPSARPEEIVLRFDRRAEILADGSLAADELLQSPPKAFQNGVETPVRYRKLGPKRVGFELDAHDPSRPLRIDPRIGLASFFGGSGSERIDDAAYDSKGALWIVGRTNSPDLPLPPNGFPSPREGSSDVYASKLERQVAPDGAETWRLVATLFLGGDGRDRAAGIRVDRQGRVYVFGDTQSANFPTSQDASQRELAGRTDGFFTVLRESDFPFFALGTEGEPPRQGAFSSYEIEYSTLVGGSGEETVVAGSIEAFIDDSGVPCAILAGHTNSSDFPTTTFAVQEQNGGGTDAFFSVHCRRPSSSYPLVYATYLGGAREEAGAAIAVAADGSFCLGTRTTSSDLPSSGFQPEPAGSTEAYLGCFEPIRRRLDLPFLYRALGRTYWGGSASEDLIDLAIEDNTDGFRLFALLDSVSTDVAPPFDANLVPPSALAGNPGGRSLLAGVFPPLLDRPLAQFWLGGGSDDTGAGLALSGGCLAVAGSTASADFPASAGFPERLFDAGADLAAGKFCFDEQLTSVETVYVGAYGSSSQDTAAAVAPGPFDDELIVGWTTAGAGPPALDPTPGAPQTEYGGGLEDGLLLELYRPRLRPEAVVGAADFVARPLAPGQILTLFGLGIGPGAVIGPRLDEAGRLDRELGGVRVLFDGEPAPMIFVSRNQLSAVAPFFLEVRDNVEVQVETDGAVSAPLLLPVAQTAPAVFTLSQTGQGQGAVLNQDSSINNPSRPASPGSLLQIFLTGVGQTAPRGVDGEIIPARQPFPQIVAPVRVRIGGVEAAVLYAGGAPNQVHGVAQINALVPRELAGSLETPLEIFIGGESIQAGVTVAIASLP